MVNHKRKIILDNEAKIALREAYNYIKKDSLQNAEKVRNEILKSIKELVKTPDKYAPDKYRQDK